MCDFCEEKKLMLNYLNITAGIEENYIILRIYGKSNFLQSFEIKYCPMCGEKLQID